MPRKSRLVAVGYPHHITQRGNYKQNTFESGQDYILYLRYLKKYAQKYELDILSYCLMPNHIHLIVVPQNEYSLSKTFGCCNTRYSCYFNKKKDSKGHLWQDRYYSCVLDERHLYAAVKYVENNPVEANLVSNAENWDFSSAKQHLYNLTGKHLKLADIRQLLDIKNWKSSLDEKNDRKLIDDITK